MEKTPQSFKDAVKLIALFQVVLEQMDTLKGTKLYKQKIKKQMNSLESSIESTILMPLKSLDNTDESLFTRIQSNLEMIMDMDTEELAQLKVVVKEVREDNESI